jgi:hypothetical protein
MLCKEEVDNLGLPILSLHVSASLRGNSIIHWIRNVFLVVLLGK